MPSKVFDSFVSTFIETHYMNRFFLFAVGCLALTQVAAQENDNYLHNRTMLERMSSQGVVGNVVPLSSMGGNTPGLIGDVYLYQDYRKATFLLYDNDKVAQGYATRLDLQRNEFDVKVGKGIKSLPGSYVRSLFWRDSLTNSAQYYVNAKDYKNEEDVPYIGFFQILSEGDLTLFKITELIFKPAERVVAHSTGSKDNRFIKKGHLYYAIGRKAIELPARKGVRKLFESKSVEMDKYVKVNEMDLTKESHLTAAFDYYNSLVKK